MLVKTQREMNMALRVVAMLTASTNVAIASRPETHEDLLTAGDKWSGLVGSGLAPNLRHASLLESNELSGSVRSVKVSEELGKVFIWFLMILVPAVATFFVFCVQLGGGFEEQVRDDTTEVQHSDEAAQNEDAETDVGEEKLQLHSTAPSGKKVCGVLFSFIIVATILLCVLVLAGPGHNTCIDNSSSSGDSMVVSGQDFNTATLVAVAQSVGQERDQQLHSAILVQISWVAATLSLGTSAIVVSFSPQRVPHDFETKGTLSNVSQDVETPRGRLFAVMLFIAGMLQLISTYPSQLYRPWKFLEEVDAGGDPFHQSISVPRIEKKLKMAWTALAGVGFMFTAACPSLSNPKGFDIVLTMVHNISAPAAMAFCLLMETFQLAYGEEAFGHFFCQEESLTLYQRMRAVLVAYTWFSMVLFVSCQVYFGLEAVLGMKVKKTYSLALVSFFGEIAVILLAFALPAISALENLDNLNNKSSVFNEAKFILGHELQ